jgi:hypothetical protein
MVGWWMPGELERIWKWPWSNRATITAVAWRFWGKQQKPSVKIADMRTEHLPNTSETVLLLRQLVWYYSVIILTTIIGTCLSTGRFLSLLTASRLCASRRQVHRRLPGAYEFCRWISVPDGRKHLELREVINFVDRLMVLCFTASSAVHAWEFMICQQCAAVISSFSPLFSVTTSKQSVPSWHGTLQSNVYFCMTPTWNTDLLQNVYVNFVMKEFPADKQFTIWWINLEQRDP